MRELNAAAVELGGGNERPERLRTFNVKVSWQNSPLASRVLQSKHVALPCRQRSFSQEALNNHQLSKSKRHNQQAVQGYRIVINDKYCALRKVSYQQRPI